MDNHDTLYYVQFPILFDLIALLVMFQFQLLIYLYYSEGYDIREISSILTAKENTVKSRLRRGREMLKGVLRNE